ncbi:MAG: tRNA pseudouridine(38-40) synthase TruA [bacterium]|nr:MAG: tRNA pseudouridine(38-40) synthase TruA [bacterium]
MRLILTLEYDGTSFHGWQVQPGLRTVQGVLESALERMMGESVRIHGSGRTDAGVHALGQVAHFDSPRDIPPRSVAMGLNTLLPRDVRAKGCLEAPEGFHARFSATGKRYRYTILNRSAPTALLRNAVWHIRAPLDVPAMREGASHLLGRKDFAAFRSSGDEGTTVRNVRILTIEREFDLLVLSFEADGFLKHMVRNITGALVEVGRGRLGQRKIEDILRSQSRQNAPKKAPPQGLTLVGVSYGEFDVYGEDRPVGNVNKTLENIIHFQ